MAGDSGMAGKVALLLWAQTLGLAGAQKTRLRVKPPWRPPVSWDRLTLTCQGSGTAGDTIWYKDGQQWEQQGHNNITVTESGTYECDRPGTGRSPPVTVLNDSLVLQVPARALLVEDTMKLRCRSRDNKQLMDVYFYHEEKQLRGSQNVSKLSLSPLQLSHSGNYSCGGRLASDWSESKRVTVTVHMPVANATITPSPLSHPVRAGDNVTLRCSVQVGSAPVTFTWLHNGQEVAQGPLLELGDIDVGHWGTYQCVATNQLGQDRHRVFRALSPELILLETPASPWVTVAAGVGGALFFLLLFVAVIVAWHRWHRQSARKNQERAPLDPPAPPEEGEVLYTQVVVTKRARASPCATTLQDPQVTYAELRGPQGRPQEPGDIYGNVL